MTYVTLIINDRGYGMTKKQAEDVLKTIKKSMKRYTIYALEKDGIYQCVKEEFGGRYGLLNAVGRYSKDGYKVHYKG